MRSSIHFRRAAAALLFAALAFPSPSRAEADAFGLGNGSDGALSVNGSTNPIINRYAEVTAGLAPGDTTIPVASTSGFGAGDLILVLQTTGIVPAPDSGNQTAIDLSNDPVGRW